jgi:hypothetical protein
MFDSDYALLLLLSSKPMQCAVLSTLCLWLKHHLEFKGLHIHNHNGQLSSTDTHARHRKCRGQGQHLHDLADGNWRFIHV